MIPVIHIFNFNVDTYNLLLLIAITIATLILKYELKRNQYNPKLYITLIIIALTTGLIGSKIYYCFEQWNDFITNPFDTFFNIAGHGWYGAFILGSISIFVTLKVKHLPILRTIDIIILIIPIGHAIGRLGCFFAGCCLGRPSNVPWAVSFPHGVLPTTSTVHPTQLYEMAIYLCIFSLLWKLRKRPIKSGLIFSFYLILASLGRFVVEFYRVNPKVLFWFTTPQILAILGFMLGVFIMIHVKYNSSHNEQLQTTSLKEVKSNELIMPK